MRAQLLNEKESGRESLRRYQVVDTESEQAFDDFTRLASYICRTPIALISLIDKNRQWFKSKIGLAVSEMPCDFAFCAHTILQRGVFVVPDVLEDERFANNPLLTIDPSIRFYAGAPLISSAGHTLGTICVIDRQPRRLSVEQESALELLARQVVSRLDFRRHLVNALQNGFAKTTQDITERKQMEERQEKLSTIVESSDDAIISKSVDGFIQTWNKGAERLFGYKAEEVINRHMSILVPPERNDELLVFHDRLMCGEHVRNYETERIHKNGKLFHVSITLSPIRNAKGEIKEFSVIFRNISKRKQTEEYLHKEQEFLKAVLENAEDGIVACNADGVQTFFNRALRKFFNLPLEPIPVRRWTEYSSLFKADGKTKMSFEEVPLLRALQGEHLRNEEIVIAPKQGQPRTFTVSAQPIFDPKGKKIGAVAVLHDITERKQAEEELAKQAAALRKQGRILNLAHVLIRDLDDKITFWNNGVENLYGWSKEEALGKVSHELFQAEFPEPLEQIKARLSRDNEWRGELVHTKKNGERVVVASTWMLYRDENGQPEAIVEDNNDITERKKLEQQLRQSHKMEAVGQLAGGVAHDFNNMLGVIIGYSDLMLRTLSSDDPLRPQIEEIRRAGDRASSLTRQLLAFSRKQMLQPKIFDLDSLITDTSKMLRRLIGENIELVTVFKPDSGFINADPDQIEQVLMNLVINARDAMPQGGKIIIETANVEFDEQYAAMHAEVLSGKYVMLSVSDTGMGMDEETRKHIFEPFFTTKETGIGTGLGLSMVYGIVKQSGGYIYVQSEPDEGAVFKIYLPREEDKVISVTAAAKAAEMPQGSETILLVEDEVMVRTLAQSILKDCGYRVLRASNGDEALRLCAEHNRKIDLLLTDVVMPLMNGRELAEKATALHSKVKVLYMSGYTGDALVHQGVQEGGVAFLEKPFIPLVLARKVREVLDA